jgi:hypothetical protein
VRKVKKTTAKKKLIIDDNKSTTSESSLMLTDYSSDYSLPDLDIRPKKQKSDANPYQVHAQVSYKILLTLEHIYGTVPVYYIHKYLR